jgi:rubrerythrin
MALLSFSGARSAWTDPVRKLKTLESFARTEEDGGRDIAAALKVVTDPEARKHLERHAKDEVRHADLFRSRAAELRAQGVAVKDSEEAGRAYDLSHGKLTDQTNAHGFLRVALADELGEVAYIAMLNVAEKRAAAMFRSNIRHLDQDDTTRAIFESILKDEHYHVAWTSTILKRWKKEGRGAEVKRALSMAKGSRFLGAWKRLGARSAAGFSRIGLVVIYFTIVLPFGLMARGKKPKAGWSTPLHARSPLDRLRSQYG